MTDYTEIYVIYFIALVVAILLYWDSRSKQKDNQEKKEKVYKPNDRFIPGVDHQEEGGLIYLDRDEIMGSEFFGILMDKMPNEETEPAQVKLLHHNVKYLQPYSMTDLFKVIQQLREVDNPVLQESYKTHVTASAIVYDFVIPKILFNDAVSVQVSVAAHQRFHLPVSISEEIQRYIREGKCSHDTAVLAEEHKEIERFTADITFANVFLSMVFKHESYLTIEHLYNRWLEQPNVNAFNVSFYKESIDHFKKLVTIYFGVMGVDVPKSYICLNAAVCEYITQTRRYDPKRSKLKVVH